MSVNFLDLKPLHTSNFTQKDDKLITIFKPKFSNSLLVKYLLPRMKQPNFTINLDAVGSFVWDLCDGNTTVHKIGIEMQQKFGEKVNPVYDRLTQFLRQLKQNNFIDFRYPPEL